MTFVCTLAEGEFHPDVHSRGEGDYLVIIPIGYDDADELYYSLWVMLGPTGGGMLELRFFIYVEDGNGKEIDQIWQSERARYLFDADARRLILMNVLFSVRSLLEVVKPVAVFMCTMDLDPGERALRKYVGIARTFEMCGYKIAKFDRYEHQCVWCMERIAEIDVDTTRHDVS